MSDLDPNNVWQVFISVFKNLMIAKGPETQKYLAQISKMVTSIPQILVGHSSWTDDNIFLAQRRSAFTEALVRRVIHVTAKMGFEEEPGGCLAVINSVSTILVANSPVR